MPHQSDRDLIGRLLSRAPAAADANAELCPSADVLGAYYDRTLSGGELADCETHIASCGRCQAVLVAMTRADSPPSVAPVRFRWFSWAPLAAAAAAGIVVAALIWPRSDARAPESEPVQMAERPPAAPAPTAPAAASSEPRAIPASPRAPVARTAPQPTPPKEADRLASREPPAAARSDSARAPLPLEAAKTEEANAQALGAPAPPAAAAQAKPTSVAALGSAAPWLGTVDASPEARWRFGARGALERWDRRAEKWLPQTSGVNVDLITGACLAPSTCWIGGKEGAVIHTVDGERWQSVPVPVREDISNIQITDPDHVTATTVNGRRFVTADAGKTWGP